MIPAKQLNLTHNQLRWWWHNST